MADEEAISELDEGDFSNGQENAGITPVEEDFFNGNSNKSAGSSSENKLAPVDQLPSGSSSGESVGSSENNDSDFESTGENVAPVRDREAVLSADKLVSSNPMKDIVRETKTKERSPEKILSFWTASRNIF